MVASESKKEKGAYLKGEIIEIGSLIRKMRYTAIKK